MVTTKALGFALLVSVAAPEGGAEVMEKAQRDDVISAVSARVRSFATAERARDAEQLLAHYAAGPECHFYHDGRRANYDLIAGGVRKALPGVRSLEVAYDDLEVIVLSAEQPSTKRVASHGSGATWMASGSSFTVTLLTRWHRRSRARAVQQGDEANKA
jgi:hypothetical protein